MIQRMRTASQPPIQRYVEIPGKQTKRLGFGGAWIKEHEVIRVSNDSEAAVPQADLTGSQMLYATKDRIQEANETLEGLHSPIELVPMGDVIEGVLEDDNENDDEMVYDMKTLYQVGPHYDAERATDANKDNGSGKGNKFQLNSDCGVAAHSIVGAEELYGKFGNKMTETASNPGLMKAEIVNQMSGNRYKEQFDAYKKVAKGNGKRAEDEEAALDDFFTEAYSKMKEESSEQNQDLDELAGINTFADPQIGEAYTISSGGKPTSKKDVWNYHWAAVIMKTGSDNVSLENYATGMMDNNKDWSFQMYGGAQAEGSGQTFHEQHRDDHAQHGDTPITIAAARDMKKKNNKKNNKKSNKK